MDDHEIDMRLAVL